MAMNIAASMSVVVGFFCLAYGLGRGVSENLGALGVFLIFLAINGFNTVRIRKLEEAVRRMTEKE